MIFRILKVSGHSMEPVFRSGQLLILSSIPFLFGTPKVGNIVVIKDAQESRLLLKRISKISNEEVFVTGDNKEHSRTFGPFAKEDIVGKVVASFG